MGSPEAAVAVADAVGTPEGAFEELTGALQGWKRKIGGTPKKGGTPRKKDIIFVAPDGEEIKNKRQLDKYLKAHPGTLSASDFEWGVPATDAVTPTENRRRSARLNSKGRTSTEGLEEETEPKPPVTKRSRKSRENGNDAASKDEPVIKLATEEVAADKKDENGEDNGDTKAMDVDESKVEVPAAEETKEVTAETLTEKAEDEKVVSEEINGEKPLETPAETKVEDVAVTNGDAAEKPNAEAEAPLPQGVHALVGDVPKPQEVEAPPAPEVAV